MNWFLSKSIIYTHSIKVVLSGVLTDVLYLYTDEFCKQSSIA